MLLSVFITDVQREKNKEELQKAIDAAIANPIDRYIRKSYPAESTEVADVCSSRDDTGCYP